MPKTLKEWTAKRSGAKMRLKGLDEAGAAQRVSVDSIFVLNGQVRATVFAMRDTDGNPMADDQHIELGTLA